MLPFLLLGLLGVHGQPKQPAAAAWPDRFYTSTNDATANAVAVFQLDAWQNLNYLGWVATNGMGSGANLGNQGAIASSGNWLFVVNAGSNSISTLWLDPEGVAMPTFSSWVSSGGTSPRSLTVWGNWLFVLNADNIVGFNIWPNGTLSMIPNSMHACASDGNAQIQFSTDGHWLVISQRGTTVKGLTTVRVDQWGVPWPGSFSPQPDHVPFGFDIDQWNRVFVGEVPTNSLSSWQLNNDGTLTFIDRNDTEQQATCWATLAPNGMFAYTANAGSDSISAFTIDRWGKLWRNEADGVGAQQAAGTHTTDLDVSADGKYLYSLGRGVVYAYWINPNGDLTRLAWWSNSTVLPNSVTGMLVPKVPKMAKAPAPASPAKKNGIIGGVMGGIGGAVAVVLVRRRRNQGLPADPKPIDPVKVVQVHV